MKNLILASAMMMGFISFSFAQTAAKSTKPEKAKTEAVKPVAKADTKTVTPAKAATPAKADKPAVKATPAKKPVAATATDKNGTVLKKDGTPDKRYKDAKPAAKGPLKKDGTPDKRFKENKKP